VIEEFSISQLAKEFAVTTRAIRHYEDIGLLVPQRIGQQRVYSATERVRLQLILRGKKIGFSLAEIKEVIDIYKLPEGKQLQKHFLIDKIAARRKQLIEQKKYINEMLTELNQITNRFS